MKDIIPEISPLPDANIDETKETVLPDAVEIIGASEPSEYDILGAADVSSQGEEPELKDAQDDGGAGAGSPGGAPASPDVGGIIFPGTTGTTGDDVIIVFEDSVASADTIDGLAGNDLIFGDMAVASVVAGTGIGTFGTAGDIDASHIWSAKNNLDVGNSAIPHTSIFGEGFGEEHYFSVTVAANQTITIDIDHAYSAIGGGSFDSEVFLYNAAQALVDENDDGGNSNGGLGSEGFNRDSYLEYTNTGATQLFYIRVGSYLNGAGATTIYAGDTYVMNVSVTGHAATSLEVFDDDSISGNAGNDSIYGNDGDDTLDGGADNDTLLGAAGTDRLKGGAGNDVLYGGTGGDVLEPGSGIDSVYGEAGNDSFWLDTADTHAGSVLDGGADTDVLNIQATGLVTGIDLRTLTLSNFETFFANADVTIVQMGANQAGFASFFVTAASSTSIEVLMGTTSTFSLAAASFSLFSATNNFTITGDGDAETITAGSLGTSIAGNGGNDTLTGGTGNDVIDGGADNDTIVGGGGNDTLTGGAGADSIDGGANDDSIEGGSGADTLIGGAGSDDTLSYSLSATGVTVNLLTSSVSGGDAAGDAISLFENITGSAFADVLTGDGAVNIIRGGGGNDTLDGNSGQTTTDFLFGDAGNDTFLMTGSSYISNVDGGADTDTLDLSGHNYSHVVNLATGVFIEGGVNATITDVENIIGSSSINTLTGDGNANDIDGGGNTDSIFGGGGNDTLTGGAGVDSVDGGADDDLIKGSSGADILIGGTGNDTLSYSSSAAGVTVNLGTSTVSGGDAAGDTVSLFENVTGSAFADILIANTATNIIRGGAGNDTIYASSGPASTDSLFGEAGNDLFLVTGTSSISNFDGGSALDKIDVSGVTSAAYNINLGTGVINQIGSGPTGTISAVEDIVGTASNDTFTGDHLSNSIVGGGGSDTILGAAGDDTLTGGAGVDSIDGGSGYDVLTGGAGADTVNGGSYADNIVLTAGENNTGASLNGGTGDDRLSVNANGGDTTYDLRQLTFTSIAELYANGAMTLVQMGANQATFGDFIVDGSSATSFEVLMGTTSTLSLTGVFFSSFSATNTFTISGDGDAETITTGDVATNVTGDAGADSITGGTGFDSLLGGADNDTLLGGAGNDTLYGEAGDDSLEGGADNDRLHGGTGADTLKGDAGNDVLIAYGSDTNTGKFLDGGANSDSLQLLFGAFDLRTMTVQNIESLVGFETATTIKLGADQATFGTFEVLGSQPTFEVFMGTTSTLSLASTTFTSFTAANTFTITGDGDAENISTGNVATSVTGNGGNDTLTGRNGNDTLNGGADNDIMYGGAGADSMVGGAGNDTLNATGGGADTLEGDAGNDSFWLNSGDDNSGSSIDGGADSDSLYLQGGALDLRTMTVQNLENIVTLSTATTIQMGADQAPTLGFYVSGGSSTAFNVFMGTTSGFSLATTTFDSFTATNSFTITGDGDAEAIIGGSFGSTIVGNGGNDTLTGGAGADSLSGGAGDDLFIASGGADTMNGGADTDTVSYAAAAAGVSLHTSTGGLSGLATGHSYIDIEKFIGSGYNDSISGNLSGDVVADHFYGGHGDDTLIGGLGNDTLIGGAGADSLDGGDAHDTFIVLDLAGSFDTLVGGSGVDIADFSDSSAGWSIVDTGHTSGTGTSGTASVTFSGIEFVIGSGFNDTFSSLGTFTGLIAGGGRQ